MIAFKISKKQRIVNKYVTVYFFSKYLELTNKQQNSSKEDNYYQSDNKHILNQS